MNCNYLYLTVFDKYFTAACFKKIVKRKEVKRQALKKIVAFKESIRIEKKRKENNILHTYICTYLSIWKAFNIGLNTVEFH